MGKGVLLPLNNKCLSLGIITKLKGKQIHKILRTWYICYSTSGLNIKSIFNIGPIAYMKLEKFKLSCNFFLVFTVNLSADGKN